MPRHPALCLLLVTISLPAQTSGRPAAQAANLIQTADLKSDIFFLASDDLARRNSASREDHIATDYIAAEFMRLGPKPMGDNGTFFQNMEIVTGNLDAGHSSLTANIGNTEHRYKLNQDFQWARQSLRPTQSCGQVV